MYAEMSARLEGDVPGPLAQAADTLARSAQKADRHYQRPDLAGLAAVAGQAAIKNKAGKAGWIILAGDYSGSPKRSQSYTTPEQRPNGQPLCSNAPEHPDPNNPGLTRTYRSDKSNSNVTPAGEGRHRAAPQRR